MHKGWFGLAGVLVIGLLPDSGSAAPAGALNKTITIQYANSGVSRTTTGQTRSYTTQISVVIYVSSQGRLFVRQGASNGRTARGGDVDPGGNRRSTYSFQGNRIVGVTKWASGASQVSVSFDPAFSSCTASVIEGRSGGNISRIAPDGERVEVISNTVSTPSCSIQSGNAFGG